MLFLPSLLFIAQPQQGVIERPEPGLIHRFVDLSARQRIALVEAVEKVEAHIKDAVERGAHVVLGGGRHELGGFFFQPTVLTEVSRTADIFRGRVIDVTEKTYTIELTGAKSKLDAFIDAIDRASILETVRTGGSSIGRGERILKV